MNRYQITFSQLLVPDNYNSVQIVVERVNARQTTERNWRLDLCVITDYQECSRISDWKAQYLALLLCVQFKVILRAHPLKFRWKFVLNSLFLVTIFVTLVKFCQLNPKSVDSRSVKSIFYCTVILHYGILCLSSLNFIKTNL